MENVLRIDIFNNRIKSIYKVKLGSKKCQRDLEESIKEILPSIDEKLLITFYGAFDNEGNPFFFGNTLVVEIFDTKSKKRDKVFLGSKEKVYEVLTSVKSTLPSNRTMKKEKKVILFSPEVFMIILALTQQFFMFEEVKFDKKISLSVCTPMGKQSLIFEGKSNSILSPGMSIEDYVGFEEMHDNESGMVTAIEINSIISAINVKTGYYSLNLEVEDSEGNRDTVYVFCGCKEFWENLKLCKGTQGILFGIDKGVELND